MSVAKITKDAAMKLSVQFASERRQVDNLITVDRSFEHLTKAEQKEALILLNDDCNNWLGTFVVTAIASSTPTLTLQQLQIPGGSERTGTDTLLGRNRYHCALHATMTCTKASSTGRQASD